MQLQDYFEISCFLLAFRYSLIIGELKLLFLFHRINKLIAKSIVGDFNDMCFCSIVFTRYWNHPRNAGLWQSIRCGQLECKKIVLANKGIEPRTVLGLRVFSIYFSVSGPIDCDDCLLCDHHCHHLEEKFGENQSWNIEWSKRKIENTSTDFTETININWYRNSSFVS